MTKSGSQAVRQLQYIPFRYRCYSRDKYVLHSSYNGGQPYGISILNCHGPNWSISKKDIEKGDMLKSRRYLNRRLGDFLKELDFTEVIQLVSLQYQHS